MTCNDILYEIMTLCSQLDDNGAINSDTTAQGYKARIPYIANLGQKELINFLKYKKTNRQTLTNTGSSGYRVVTKPTDCGILSSIIDKYGNERINDTTFTYEYNGSLYITNNYDGEIVLEYVPNPAAITTLDSAFTLQDNYISPCLTNFIAYNLMMDADGSRSNLYLQKYQEERSNLRKIRLGKFSKIRNVY